MQFPAVMIQWPDGLSGQPVILPVAESYEQEQEIFRIIERALAVAGNGH